jgi:UDP:flavonoid glycosyltransferase YjiC (YdhE family)
MRFGYRDPPQLRGLLRAWRDLIAAAGAQVLVADHAPTALLAARALGMARAVFGNPFGAPPPSDPTPSLVPGLKVPPQRLASSDAAVIETINASQDGPGLAALRQMFEGATLMLLGAPELDPYGPRDARHYIGLLAASLGGRRPAWPAGVAPPRAIGYLKAGHPHVEAVLEALAASGIACTLHLSGSDAPGLARRHERPGFAAGGALDMEHAAAECDFVICHAGMGTTIAALRAGKPLLLLPNYLEQLLTARLVEGIGAARVLAPDEARPDVRGALQALGPGGGLRAAAGAFAARHGRAAIGTIVSDVVNRIEAMRAPAAVQRPA